MGYSIHKKVEKKLQKIRFRTLMSLLLSIDKR